jgi:glycopeptide antibiotics resistance protein
MQRRGDRFRIRVSKRQIMDIAWDSILNNILLMLPVAVVLGTIGGISSSAFFDAGGPGVVTGILLSLCSYPLISRFTKYFVEKHKAEVANTTRQLSELVLQSTTHKKSEKPKNDSTTSTAEIEIPDEQEAEQNKTGKLRNNLRE